MGQLSVNKKKKPPKLPYEKDPKERVPRSGIPFGHRILNYEDMYVTDVGYKAEYYKGKVMGILGVLVVVVAKGGSSVVMAFMCSLSASKS